MVCEMLLLTIHAVLASHKDTKRFLVACRLPSSGWLPVQKDSMMVSSTSFAAFATLVLLLASVMQASPRMGGGGLLFASESNMYGAVHRRLLESDAIAGAHAQAQEKYKAVTRVVFGRTSVKETSSPKYVPGKSK